MKIKERISNLLGSVHRFFRRLWHSRHVIGDLVKHKHRFVVLDTQTYKEKISFQLSGINIFVFLGITSLILIFLTSILLAFTPLRELIPGYSNDKMTRQTYENAMVIDSLEAQLHNQEEMLADIQYIMLGKDPASRHADADAHGGDSVKVTGGPDQRNRADSLMRQEVEQQGGDRDYATPLKGRIATRFSSRNHVDGITVEGRNNDKVVAAQNGTILLADKSSDDVWTVVIQHYSNELSIYKGSGRLLKNAGNDVQAGEPLLQLKSAKNSEPAVLYFELRRLGEAVNPEKLF